jgi:uncharacterized protein YjbJ (UPF0337 family)
LSGGSGVECDVESVVVTLTGENMMRESTKDEIAGKVHEVKGAVKEKAGRIIGNPDLEGQGAGERVAGKVQKTIGRVEAVLGK